MVDDPVLAAEVVFRPPGGDLSGWERITAENVAAFRPDAGAVKAAADFFAQQGFEVSAQRGISMTVTGRQSLFERVFATRVAVRGAAADLAGGGTGTGDVDGAGDVDGGADEVAGGAGEVAGGAGGAGEVAGAGAGRGGPLAGEAGRPGGAGPAGGAGEAVARTAAGELELPLGQLPESVRAGVHAVTFSPPPDYGPVAP